jgi:hypothetical protein
MPLHLEPSRLADRRGRFLMAVMEADIYEEADPNGTPIGTITDEDVIDMWFEPHWRKKGVGEIVMNRHHAKAGLLANDRYIKWRVPVIQEAALFGSWMRQGRVILSTGRGQAAETVTMGGPGARDILRFARLLKTTYAPVPPASEERGSSTDEGLWRWLNQHRGAIAARVMEEGQNQAIDTLLAPLSQCTFDWDRDNDSNGDPWAGLVEQVEQRWGIDADTFMAMLEEAGGFIVFADPDLGFHAYQEYPFRDLTDTVTFQAEAGGSVAPNVASDMERDLDSTDRWNAVAVDSMATADGLQEYTDGSDGEIGRIGYMASPSAGSAFRGLIAVESLTMSHAGTTRLAVEIDPLTHLPGPEGSNGSYWLYDYVHVQSRDGSGPWDIDEDKHVSAIRFGLRTASDDATDDRATRSLITTVLLDDDPIHIVLGGGDT